MCVWLVRLGVEGGLVRLTGCVRGGGLVRLGVGGLGGEIGLGELRENWCGGDDGGCGGEGLVKLGVGGEGLVRLGVGGCW